MTMQTMAVQQQLSFSMNAARSPSSRWSDNEIARSSLGEGKAQGYCSLRESLHGRPALVSSFSGMTLSPVHSKAQRHSRRVRRHSMEICCSENGTTVKKPLRVMISGAPASGKGTQCEQIVERYGLTHISAGDLLRAEVAAGTEYGKKAKAFMDAGDLVPDEVVVTMVKARLAQKDAQEKGWLLDGYPRSASQAAALESGGIRPDIFVVLEVPDDILVDRVVGRRQDPVTGRIYHMTYSPPENAEIAARLTQRSDDTEEKVKNRLSTHKSNVESVISTYEDILAVVDGNRSKDSVFEDVDSLLQKLQERGADGGRARKEEEHWRGVPTKLNSIPHGREIRQYFYKDVCRAVKQGVEDKRGKMEVKLTIPELNPEMDVYRVGTLLELIRDMALTFAEDGKRVRVCVQGSMGQGIFSGVPLAIAGVRRMIEIMDWGDDDLVGNFIFFGSVGPKEIQPEDDIIILASPMNAVGNCILDDLEPMVEVAGNRPFIVVNPRLADIPSAAGVMQIKGREERRKFADSFFTVYNFRLLYLSSTNYYPILGALRRAYPGKYEIYRREDTETEVGERYDLMGTYDNEPKGQNLADAYAGKKRSPTATTFWGRLFS